jgi:hypothetical protein
MVSKKGKGKASSSIRNKNKIVININSNNKKKSIQREKKHHYPMQQIHQYPPYLNQNEGLLNILKINNDNYNMIREKLSELSREERILPGQNTSSSHLIQNPINISKLPLNRGMTDSSIGSTTMDSYSRIPNNSSSHKQSSIYDKVTKR